MIGGVFLALGYWILPWFAHGNPLFSPASQIVKSFCSWIAGFFAFIAAIKAILAFVRSRNTLSAAVSVPTHRRPRATVDHIEKISNRPTVRHEPSLTRGPSPYLPKPCGWSLELLQAVEWKRFEDLCQKFYETKGIRSACTALGPDGGIDIRLYQGDSEQVTAIVQCKAWGESYVGVKPIRELLGVMVHEKGAVGISCCRIYIESMNGSSGGPSCLNKSFRRICDNWRC